ncbi:hypothetical protein OS493_003562 [Desmophyllum pertusum]|uniref:Uncharacterized protein n=1 Tax=Desmophyllum pertusum TaxID=174260 RepID=A0A9X0A982_9CNID|nr:hypothetical protein OS493_003562 [Desmophyllum pertusum]
MKDQLRRYLLPSADMKKAIDRNTKQDEDLLLVLEQLDKEKRVALDQLSRKQDTFKKQMIKRRDSLPQKFQMQFFQHRNVADRVNRPRPDESSTQARHLLRRPSLSCVETRRGVSLGQLPAVKTKRYSLPASPLPRDNSEELNRFTFKPGSEITSPRRTENAAIHFNYNRQQSEQDESTNEDDDYFEVFSTNKMASNKLNTKSHNSTAQNVIRRHSDVAAVDHHINTPRLLQRRRTVTIHSLSSVSTCLSESVIRL